MSPDRSSSPRCYNASSAPLRVLVLDAKDISPATVQRVLEKQGRSVELLRPAPLLERASDGLETWPGVVLVPLDMESDGAEIGRMEMALAHSSVHVLYLGFRTALDGNRAEFEDIPGLLVLQRLDESELADVALMWPAAPLRERGGEQSDSWKMLLEAWGGPALACGPGGFIIAANSAMVQLAGVEIVGRTCSEADLSYWDVNHPDMAASPLEWQMHCQHDDEWYHVHSIPLPREAGGAVRLSLGRKSTRERDLQLRAAELEEEFAQRLAEETQQEKERLKKEAAAFRKGREEERDKSGFMYAALQALTSPITGVLGFTKLMQRDMGRLQEHCGSGVTQDLANKAARSVKIVLHEGLNLSRLAGNAVELVRLGEQQAIQESGSTEISGAVYDAVQDTDMAVILGRKPEVQVQLDADIPRVAVGCDDCRTILFNVLLDALAHAKGLVSVQGGKEGDAFIRLKIQDQGPPLSEREWRLAFDRMYHVARPDTRTGQIRGADLGLALAAALARLYGGALSGASDAKTGNVLQLLLPVV